MFLSLSRELIEEASSSQEVRSMPAAGEPGREVGIGGGEDGGRDCDANRAGERKRGNASLRLTGLRHVGHTMPLERWAKCASRHVVQNPCPTEVDRIVSKSDS